MYLINNILNRGTCCLWYYRRRFFS